MAEALAKKINQVSICMRSGKSVQTKIMNIEASWRKAHDWVNCTGQGVLESNPEGFAGEVKKRCRYYYTLYDVMSDRASARALASTDELYDGSVNLDNVSSVSGNSTPSIAAESVENRPAKNLRR